MKLGAELKAFEERIGHRFANPELLVQALTHGSIATATRPDNQRLEFLGDRVLGLAMATALLDADAKASEGQLAPRFNALVRKEACADVAREIGLGDVLKLGRSEMLSGGRRKEALLADGLEALIAAVYVDAGFEAAQDFVLRLWGDRVGRVEADARDAKTALQEWAHTRGPVTPQYEIVERSGPDHDPLFTVRVSIPDVAPADGQGRSRRIAEQEAATAVLIRESVWKDDN